MRNKLFLVIMALLLISTLGFAKTTNKEMRFQLGIGGYVNTSNILGLIENVRMTQALEGGGDYNYPGIDQEEREALENLNLAMRRGIMIANILGGLEYGIKTRILWNILIAEADLSLVPYNGSYNGRLDFAVSAGIGVRAPFFIMPYFTVGPMFTFSFYPSEFTKYESWKSNYGGFGNFVFRPGLNSRLGLDLKFKKWSFGLYYQYTIRDFQEFTGWYSQLVDSMGNTQQARAEAAGMIFGAQSKFGAHMTFYLF